MDTALQTLSEIPNPTDSDNYFTPADCLGLVGVMSDLGIPDAQPKDIQRTVRTRISSIKEVTPDIAEILQGHSFPGMRAVYDRCDYFEAKLAALCLWEKDLEMTVHPLVKK